MELLIAFLTTLIKILVLSTIFFESLISLSHIIQHDVAVKYTSSFVWAVVIVVTYNLVIYPLTLDPLRKFPLVDINDLRIVFPVTDVPRGDHALTWAKTYPEHDAIRVRMNRLTTVLVPMSPDALRDVLGVYQQDFVKPLAGRNYISRLLGYGLILLEGSAHARQRKQLLPHFRIQNIRTLHGLMSVKADLMLQKMEQESQGRGKVEVGYWASKATLDIIGATLMSKDFNSLETRFQVDHDAFLQLTTPSSGQTILFGLGLILPKWVVSLIPNTANRMIHQSTSRLRETCQLVLTELYQKKSRIDNGIQPDILSSIVRDSSMSRENIIDQMLTFLGAGHETTATSIVWITHLLTLPENRKYQDLVRDEIIASSGYTSSAVELEKLPWLNAICDESLRLFPPVTTTARKAVRDVMIANTRVPSNTTVVLFPWAINRNPRFWGGPDSERFIPERWIDTLPDGRLRVNKHGGAQSNYCELTFLHGNRSCIGKDYAKAELRCIVAKMFGKYIVERLPGDDGKVTPTGNITIKPAGGLFVKLTRV